MFKLRSARIATVAGFAAVALLAVGSPALATTVTLHLIAQTTATQVHYPIGIAKSGSHVFTAEDGGPNTIAVTDVSNPSTPTVTQVLDLTAMGMSARQISVSGDKLVFVNGFTDAVGVVTGVQGSSLVRGGVTPSSGAGSLPQSSGPFDVFALGNYAYTANRNPAGGNSLSVINISDASHPVQVGITPSSGAGAFPAVVSGSFDGACDLVVIGSYAYVVNRQNAQVVTVDVSNPAHPVVVAESPVSGSPGGLTGSIFEHVVTNGTLLAVTDTGAGVVRLFSLGDAAHGVAAARLSGFTSVMGSAPNAAAFVGSKIYVASSVMGDFSIDLWDVADPSAPISVVSSPAHPTSGSVPQGAWIEGLVAEAGHAYFADSGYGLGMGVVEVAGVDWPVSAQSAPKVLANTGVTALIPMLAVGSLLAIAGTLFLVRRRRS